MAPAALTTNFTPSGSKSLTSLLSDVVESLSATSDALSTTLSQPDTTLKFLPPQNGISLLDVKNELMLSYLHNVIFLVLLKLRGGSLAEENSPGEGADESNIGNEVVKKLVELRVLLERGVKPIESKLKYQIDKVVRTALEEEMERKAMGESVGKKKREKKRNGKMDNSESEENANGEEDYDDDNDDDDGSDDENESGKESSDEEEEEDDDISIDGINSRSKPKPTKSKSLIPQTVTKEELAYRPNLLAFVKTKPSQNKNNTNSNKIPSSSKDNDQNPKQAIYRPPKISATTMPDLPSTRSLDSKTQKSRPLRSSALDEFIASELSSAPLVQPSIGSTIAAHGRIHKTAKQRTIENERREYEENNFVRLPGLTKKERERERKLGAGKIRDNFGGEDWRSFAGDLDSIASKVENSAVRKSRGMSALENSRKRKGGGDDGENGAGAGMVRIGGKYRSVVHKMKRRKR